MENQVLSIDQMKHLQELGLDTSKSSMCWRRIGKYATGESANLPWRLYLNNGNYKEYDVEYETIPTFTLQDILDLLPYKIKSYFLLILKDKYAFREGNCYSIFYRNVRERKSLIKICRDSLLDTAYEMLCWCFENGHIKQ